MFENRALRRVGECRVLHNEEVCNLEEEVGRTLSTMGRRGAHIGFLWENHKDRDH
jgi:hypothetical protein